MLNAKPIKFLFNLFYGVVPIAFSFHIFMNFNLYFLYKYFTSHVSFIYFLYHDIYENFSMVELHKIV